MTRLTIIKDNFKNTSIETQFGTHVITDIHLHGSHKLFRNREGIYFVISFNDRSKRLAIIDKHLLRYNILKNVKLRMVEQVNCLFRIEIANIGESVLEDL